MSNILKEKILFFLLSLSLLIGLYRIFPFFSLNIPLGYDPGLYRLMFFDYINNLPNIDFSNLDTYTKGGLALFLGPLVNILHLVGFSVDNLLTFGIGFFSLITSFFIYINLKKYGKITGIIGIIIFMISIIQYQSFFMNYYKQIVGIIFLLTGIYLLEKKKYLLSIPIIISIFTIHRPTGLFFLLIIIFYSLFQLFYNKNYRKEIKKGILVVFVGGIISFLMYLPLFNELILNLIKPLFTTALSGNSGGTFFSINDFIKYDFLFLILSFYGIYLKLKSKDFDYLFFGYIVGFFWILFKLFFYNRFLIFFDIFVILFSAYALGEIFKQSKIYFYLIFGLFFLIQSIFYINYVSSYNQPYISQEAINDLKKINKEIPKNAYLMTNYKGNSPWVSGYGLRSTITPLLFEYDKWGEKGWMKWWGSNGKVKCDMLKDTYNDKQPLYIWLTKVKAADGKFYPENLKGAYCFEKTKFSGEGYVLYKINFNNN